MVNDITLSQSLEMGIVVFNDEVTVLQHPALVESFTMPRLGAAVYTRLVDGVRMAIDMASYRKGWYKETGRPNLCPGLYT